MNISRAQQIIESEKEIEVLHNGTPVWLQSVDESKQTARAYTRQQPDNEMDIPVNELHES
ncbi:H-type small acid-soluble spore protein [Fictibacillus phosphorivorans]|uniref:H-type small acid-soluble spore protein n=1 Tax=Fictibacillus phosphorivorans TaxID=1221500 RepID=UPI00203D60B0|nr:H-type small acid-soluble spore protein [Fictibacillus phosphorivorans]MCM3719958.1 H-type small acid-soluble spore protein [Fictibacillus phosphorivorans]MCM3777685.1 H-type small acid-soluble spore protein [Fictibacillus phosphorivorans]